MGLRLFTFWGTTDGFPSSKLVQAMQLQLLALAALCRLVSNASALPCRSLGAKIALHLGVYHSSIFGKLISDAGSAGGPNSSTAVLDAVDVGIPVVQRLTKFKTLLERPSNAATVCQWVLVRSH